MPPLPKKKYPKARQGKRRQHIRVAPKELTRCSQCRNMRLPHTVCPTCGYYHGREAVPMQSPTLGG
ncbi:MAG: 50S ribosomal protein L32 [Dehalococcoidia bacterium]